MKKNSPGHFDKFAKKKSNAAIKEQFKQEKRKWKKEREVFFEKKKQSATSNWQLAKDQRVTSNQQPATSSMPLNKFIAHCGVCSRRDAAEFVKLGKVKVNNETITEPGHKVSTKDEIKVNGKKYLSPKISSIFFSINPKTISQLRMILIKEKPFLILLN